MEEEIPIDLDTGKMHHLCYYHNLKRERQWIRTKTHAQKTQIPSAWRFTDEHRGCDSAEANAAQHVQTKGGELTCHPNRRPQPVGWVASMGERGYTYTLPPTHAPRQIIDLWVKLWMGKRMQASKQASHVTREPWCYPVCTDN